MGSRVCLIIYSLCLLIIFVFINTVCMYLCVCMLVKIGIAVNVLP